VTIENTDKTMRASKSSIPLPDDLLASLPAADLPKINEAYDLLVTGVGGTGVVTVGALITMAAHLQGKGASVLDFMGFAQKFGPVLSYIRVTKDPADLNQVRIDDEQADALIGCDLVVSSSPKASKTYRRGHTRGVLNTTEMATADFVRFRDASLRADTRISALENALGDGNLSGVAANQLAEKLLGNSIYANVLMLGFAWQKGLLPVSIEALMRAVELNGVAIDNNKAALNWGRIAAADISAIERLLNGPVALPATEESLEKTVERRAEFLKEYQNQALADRFIGLVERTRDAESRIGGPESTSLTLATCKAWFKTLAYKDEYEVARLHVDSDFLSNIKERYGKNAKIKFHLAPPILSAGKDSRGRPRKREFGAWMIPAFKVLARMKGLRGTAFDLFGKTKERKMERALIAEFDDTNTQLLASLSPQNLEEAIAITNRYLDIRGYGLVKELAAAEVRADVTDRLAVYAAEPAMVA
jgi:indolepyruvate ferredoxin oxidoreductase